MAMGYRWLRHRVPMPRLVPNTPGEKVFTAVVTFAWLAGLFVNLLNPSLATAAGMAVGAVVGGVLTVGLVKVLAGRARDADQRRIDAALDAEG